MANAKAPKTDMLTESVNSASRGLDSRDTRRIVEIMHGEDLNAWRAIDVVLEEITRLVDDVVRALSSGGRLLYIGAGTSGRLGVLDASECPPTFGVESGVVVGVIAGGDRALRDSVEGAEDSTEDGEKVVREYEVRAEDVVCGIASSGTTPFVVGALRESTKRQAVTALITCNRLASDVRADLGVDHLVELLVGPEIIAGSTRMKAGTATKMVLNMVTTAAMVRLGKVYENLMVDVRPVNRKLVRRATSLISTVGGVGSDRAAELLTASHQNVKVAIVMARCRVTRERGEALLAEAGGFLRRVLEDYTPKARGS